MPQLDCNYSSPPRPGGVNLNGHYPNFGILIVWRANNDVLGQMLTGLNGNFDMFATLTPGTTYTMTVTALQGNNVLEIDTQQWTVPAQ